MPETAKRFMQWLILSLKHHNGLGCYFFLFLFFSDKDQFQIRKLIHGELKNYDVQTIQLGSDDVILETQDD